MQNIGFVYSLVPGLKSICSDSLDKAAARYLRFFNTHPYMSPTIAGVFLHLEEKGEHEMIENLQKTIAGSLAAIGDYFFWATLKPLIALLFILSVFTGELWGIILTLIVYNGLHLWAMSWGFMQGYLYGPQGTLKVGRALSVERAKLVSYATSLLSGAVLALISLQEGIGAGLVPGILIFCACIAAQRLRLGVFWIFYGIFTLTLIWAIIQ